MHRPKLRDFIHAGGPGDDAEIHGRAGSDWIYGGGGNDRIDGWKGDDTIYGDYHPDDDEFGTGGDDEIYGWTGDDTIFGGPGDDNLFGEEGDDTIYGGDFQNGQPIVYPGDEDWIYPDDGGAKYPRVDLVANVAWPDVIDGSFYSSDNREENGFYGSLQVPISGSRIKVEINVHSTPGVDLDGETLRLGDYDTSVIQLYDAETGGNLIDPNDTWLIDGSSWSTVVWIDPLALGDTSLTISVDGFEGTRPLLDLMYVLVKDQPS